MTRRRQNSQPDCSSQEAELRSPNGLRANSPDLRDETIARLEESLKARDHFLAVVAHELRNPLTALQLRLALIRQAESRGDHGRLIDQLDHLELLLERFVRRTTMLLNVAQLAADKLLVEISEFNLSELIMEIVNDQQPLLQRSGSELVTQIEPQLTVHLDAIATSQIVENLLSNAIKYGLGNPIELCVSSRCGEILISVRDHGIGIDEDDLDRIFQPFERAVTRGFRSGFGLGLWVTRQLADAMGGSIEAAGIKASGSVFTVTLPSGARGTNEQ